MKGMEEEELDRLNHYRVQLVEKVDNLMFVLKQKRKSIYVDKLIEIFKKQQLMSFLTDEYMEPFKKLKAWEKGLLKSNLLGVVE